MDNSFKKAFHLQGLRVTNTLFDNTTLIISCTPSRMTTRCKRCGNAHLTVHQKLAPKRVKHMFWAGGLVELSLSKRVFSCWPCQKRGYSHTTVETIPLIPRYQRYTVVFADQIMKGLGSTSFKTQAELAGSSFSVLARLLRERIDPFVGVWPDEPVTSLGLDCHSFSGHQMLPTLCDLTHHRLITILPDDTPGTLQRFLQGIPAEKRLLIREVCTDMDTQYLKVLRQELPRACHVVDFFHLVQDANHRVSEQRILIQQAHRVRLPLKLFAKNKEHLDPNERTELNLLCQTYPELGALWRVKEKIRLIHKTPSGSLAAIFYTELTCSMQASPWKSVRAWAKTLVRWQPGILQYFERHTSNGYTEGVNTKLKTIKRLSYGFRSLQNYIRKALLAFIPLAILTHYLK